MHGQWKPSSFISLSPRYFFRGTNYLDCCADVSPRDAQFLSNAFHTVDGLIQTLRAQLPDLAQLDGRSPAARTVLLTHSLLNAATIKLHGLFMASDPASRQTCLAAARDMFHFGDMNLQGLGYLNPMMGVRPVARL